MDWGRNLNTKQSVFLIIWIVLFFDVFICNRPVWLAYVIGPVGLIVTHLLRDPRQDKNRTSETPENEANIEKELSNDAAASIENRLIIATMVKYQKGVLIIVLLLLGDLFLCRNERPLWGNILAVTGLLGACLILLGALELDKHKTKT